MGWPTLTGDDRTAMRSSCRAAHLPMRDGDATVLAHCGIVLVHIAQDYDRGMQIIVNAVEANPNNLMVLIMRGHREPSLRESRGVARPYPSRDPAEPARSDGASGR